MSITDFSVDNSQLQFKGAVLGVRTDHIVMPDGETFSRDVIEHYGAVAVIAYNEQGEIALISQYRHPLGRYNWEIPAGLLDGPETETPLAAANRELIEEIGYSAKIWAHLVDMAASPGCSDEVVRIFYASDLHSVPRPQASAEEKTLELSWVPLTTAVEMIAQGKIFNATAIVAILVLSSALSAHTPFTFADPESEFTLRPHALPNRRSC